MPILGNVKSHIMGLTIMAAGMSVAQGAVISEQPGVAGVGVVSSELTPGPGQISGPVPVLSPNLQVRPLEARGEGHVRIAALSYEPADLITSVSVPGILSQDDIALYQAIYELQEVGNWAEADLLKSEISNDILLGYVQFQRYMHPTDYRSKFKELAAWLEDYSDHPDAYRIYRLAMKRRPEGAAPPRKAKAGYLSGYGEERSDKDIVFPLPKAGDYQPKKVAELAGKVRSLIGRGRPTQAWRVLADFEGKSWLTDADFDQLRTDIARGYYAFGKDNLALDFAGAAAARSRSYVPEADWISGLAAWRLGLLGAARTFFETLATSNTGEDFLKAGGAYWAARVHEVDGRKGLAEVMLRKASELPRTLYGLLALRSLKEHPPFYWAPLSLRETHLAELLAVKHVQRAIALVEIGQRHLAEDELRKYFPTVDIYGSDALLRLAVALDLPALQIRIGGLLEQSSNRPYEVALYPTPDWGLEGGYSLDQALVLSVVRQESKFNEHAISRRGARGLMQLMPRTATFIDGERRYHRNGNANQLYDSKLNVGLGQRYLSYLLSKEMFDGDILRALAAYNSGPSTLQKWLREVDYRDDPLLFIESVPSRETRWFLRRVLTNVGVYRDRLGQKSLWLSAIASGDWPNHVEAEKTATVEQFAGD